MKSQVLRTVASAAVLLTAGVASAAVQQAPVPGPAQRAPAAVSSFYNTWRSTPIWFRVGSSSAAVGRLVSILKRAPFDGFASGPQLAAQVEAAIARASTRNPADVSAAERTLSEAWVLYVQALKRPTPGMYYAYPMLAPQGARADQILLTAAAAPSLDSYLVAVSNVNQIYAQIRDAAVAEAQVSGNVAPDARVLANLERARTIPATGRVAVVDIAAQRLTMFQDGAAVDSMKVIVGKSEYPTPLIASYISYITLNPYWDSPDHLVREAIAPNAVHLGFGYLKSKGYEVMADWSPTAAVVPPGEVDWKAVIAGKEHIRIRQKPGPNNFMATMKIPFVNDDDIYLHDTPTKSLFSKPQRALSNGCVRLEDAPRFARWLLYGHDPVAAAPDLPEQQVKLPESVPVYLTYLTAQPQGGKLTYVADFYGLDKTAAGTVAGR